MAIAKVRRETLSAVARAAYVEYRLRNRELLDEIKATSEPDD